MTQKSPAPPLPTLMTNYETRFLWQKRIEKAPQNPKFNVNGSFNCNKFVTFSSNDGTVSSVEQNLFMVIFGHCTVEQTARATVTGRVRLLFVDA